MNKRKKQSAEHINKRIESRRNNGNFNVSEKTREKMRVAKLGRKISEETKQKMSVIRKGKPFSGKRTFSWKGKKFSNEHRRKLSESHKGKNSRENHPNWKGGYNKKEYSVDWVDYLRESIRIRDEHICQECGIHQEELQGIFKQLDVHHIDYNKLNCNPQNLFLCAGDVMQKQIIIENTGIKNLQKITA